MYYRSPLGQKEVLASREALVQYSAEFPQRYESVLGKVTDDFIKRLQALVVKCNCKN